MLFSTPTFLFAFLPVVIIGYRLLRGNLKLYFLMTASLIFYAWGEPKYVLIMLLSITVNYTMGILLHTARGKPQNLRKLLLAAAVLCNIGVLYYFKYLGFTADMINRLLGTRIQIGSIIMPIGISFFTFQGMSYVIDLYRGKVNVQKNPALTAFYISFFPQLIAGPIVRYINIEGQIRSRDDSLEKFTAGIRRFITGLAKKVIIANTAGYTADLIFSNPALENTMATAWLGVICYAFQIYFDFSGYSDMAIGLGKMFGFDFLENFNYPYISKTITEFWRRWHISLSTWFRDYLYIPLGGNRTGNVYVNLLIVFVITGLWHGAGLQFLAWGLWHGAFLIIERVLKLTKSENRRTAPLRYIFTMLIVLIGWVFFRADGLREAVNYIGIMSGAARPVNPGFTVWYYIDAKLVITLIIAAAASLPVTKTKLMEKVSVLPVWKYTSAAASLVLFFICAVFVVSSSYNPFIYFRF